MAPSFFSKLVKSNTVIPERSSRHTRSSSSRDYSQSSTTSRTSSSAAPELSPRPTPQISPPTEPFVPNTGPLSTTSTVRPSDNTLQVAPTSDASNNRALRNSASNSSLARKFLHFNKSGDLGVPPPMPALPNGARKADEGKDERGVAKVNGSGAGEQMALQEAGSHSRNISRDMGEANGHARPVCESPTSEAPIVNVLVQNAYVNAAAPAAPATAGMDISAPTTAASDADFSVQSHGSSTRIASASGSPTRSKKGKGWRRGSIRSRKGSSGGNLASALAASGLAMANHGMRMSPPPMPTNSADNYPYKQQPSPKVRQHRQDTSAVSHENGLDENDEFYSNSEASDSDSDDLDDVIPNMPITGFAVASNKRNADFHELFPSVPEGDYLIEDYGCALQRDILVQGRFYISENHLAFHANIFGWITNLIIPVHDILSIEKKMTAFVIPNAIQITTRNAKYTFASFLSRDTTYDVVHNIWRLAKPEGTSPDSMSLRSDPRQSFEESRGSLEHITGDSSSNGVIPPMPVRTTTAATARPHKSTQCACGKAGQHYTDTAMEIVLPGTPEKIYSLMFASGFIKEFMSGEQKLMDLQISDWFRQDGTGLLSRTMSYIKPLSGGLGPKQTKCELKDETVHCDFDDYVSTVTTTRTPDVPSGSVFSVKTRTCLMWASSNSTKILVTTQVEWTGRSFIKSIIERSCIDGQKTYHTDLERAMRAFIAQHRMEFVPEGIEAAVVEPPEAIRPVTPIAQTPGEKLLEDESKRREHERNQRGMQWAWDTAMGAWNVAKSSTVGALDLVGDAWEASSATPILYFVIVILVISNIWTLMMVGRREEIGRRKEMKKIEEREKWVQSIVTGLWEEFAAGRGPMPQVQYGHGIDGLEGNAYGTSPAGQVYVSGDWRHETDDINKALDGIEQRVARIRQSLQELD